MTPRFDASSITQFCKEHPVIAIAGGGTVALAGAYVVGGIILSMVTSIIFMPAGLAAVIVGAGYIGYRYLAWKFSKTKP